MAPNEPSERDGWTLEGTAQATLTDWDLLDHDRPVLVRRIATA